MRDIYCIGDSHISIFVNDGKILLDPRASGKWGQFEAVNAGPFLAYNLNDKDYILELLSNIGNRDLLLCFGEIDCRAQVKRYCEAGRDYKDIITEIADRYFETIGEIKKKLSSDCNIYILSVTPELKEEPNGYMYKRDSQDFTASYGTLAERKQYKELFNSILKYRSEENGYEYVPLNECVVLKDGSANEALYYDDVHLHPAKMKDIITNTFRKIELYNKFYQP